MALPCVCRLNLVCPPLGKRLFTSVVAAKTQKRDSVRPDGEEGAKNNAKPDANWQTVVGLEIHAQISAKTKLFSSAGTSFAAPPNALVSPFDAGHPGTLPVLNRRCVEAGVKTALALDCQVNNISAFDRKHYFYADLPAGYQITQQRRPLAVSGRLEFPVVSGSTVTYRETRVKQVQLEQDSGKSLHDADRSLVDLNRAGVGLMEIVCEPDLRSAAEAVAFVKELVRILRRIKTCDCKMEEGSLRVDVNVSVCRPGDPDLGVRTEIKNLSSLNSVSRAIEHESRRQVGVVSSGGRVVNETRGYNDEAKVTVPMRDKEEKQDYRFMPEPNLPPLNLEAVGIDVRAVRDGLPELPDATRRRLVAKFGLKPVVACSLVDQDDALSFFFEVMSKSPGLDPSTCANFVLIHVLGEAAERGLDDCRELPGLTDTMVADMLYLVDEGYITFDSSGKILKKLAAGDERHPRDVADNDGYTVIQDVAEVEKLCLEVLKRNVQKVAKAKAGKHRAFNGLVSELRKTHGDRLHMASAVKIMQATLEKFE